MSSNYLLRLKKTALLTCSVKKDYFKTTKANINSSSCATRAMPTGTPIGKELKERVIDAFLNNEKQADIARRFQLPRYSVSKIIIRYKERGHLNNNPKSGRLLKTTINMDRRIKRISENDPWKSASKIIAEIPEVGVSTRTIQRRLVAAKLFSRRPAKKPLIFERNRRARLQFAREHLNWTMQDWRKVLFSDETRYKLFNSDGMKRVRRPINTRFNPKYVTPTVKHGHGSVFLWGCFSWNGVGPLSFIEGNMDRFIYRDILQDVMLPYAEWEMPLRFIFQQDNDPKHTSALVNLNPIENLWEEVERRIRIQRFSNKQSLIDKIKEMWSNLDENVIQKLISSMPRRYNGFLPQGDRGRRRSKFVLYKRPTANGVKRSKHYVVKTPHSSQAILDANQHSISYTLSRNHAVIVEYTPDDDTDMFQIGRSSEAPIDFVVMDTVPGDKTGETKVMQSTISRFACRILCDRKNPKIARIYAAGFDTSKNIFLGEKATKWQENGREIDGLTTNGVLIMHPRGTFCGGDAKCSYWLETSVGGGVFSLRESRSAQQKGQVVENETNILEDGTLIDLCGATLLWRSAEGLTKSPSKRDLEREIDEINAGRPQCPVGLNTLVIPRKVTPNENLQQPYVYLNCGHVQGLHDWGQDKDSGARKCPICLELGPVVKVFMGLEPAFYVDSGPPTFAFNPCGHMATEKTVKYWANVAIPHGTNGFHAVCPFCASPLAGSPGYVRLIFQDNVD